MILQAYKILRLYKSKKKQSTKTTVTLFFFTAATAQTACGASQNRILAKKLGQWHVDLQFLRSLTFKLLQICWFIPWNFYHQPPSPPHHSRHAALGFSFVLLLLSFSFSLSLSNLYNFICIYVGCVYVCACTSMHAFHFSSFTCYLRSLLHPKNKNKTRAQRKIIEAIKTRKHSLNSLFESVRSIHNHKHFHAINVSAPTTSARSSRLFIYNSTAVRLLQWYFLLYCRAYSFGGCSSYVHMHTYIHTYLHRISTFSMTALSIDVMRATAGHPASSRSPFFVPCRMKSESLFVARDPKFLLPNLFIYFAF